MLPIPSMLLMLQIPIWGYAGAWGYGSMGIWGYGDMGIWGYGDMGIWGYDYGSGVGGTVFKGNAFSYSWMVF